MEQRFMRIAIHKCQCSAAEIAEGSLRSKAKQCDSFVSLLEMEKEGTCFVYIYFDGIWINQLPIKSLHPNFFQPCFLSGLNASECQQFENNWVHSEKSSWVFIPNFLSYTNPASCSMLIVMWHVSIRVPSNIPITNRTPRQVDSLKNSLLARTGENEL